MRFVGFILRKVVGFPKHGSFLLKSWGKPCDRKKDGFFRSNADALFRTVAILNYLWHTEAGGKFPDKEFGSLNPKELKGGGSGKLKRDRCKGPFDDRKNDFLQPAFLRSIPPRSRGFRSGHRGKRARRRLWEFVASRNVFRVFIHEPQVGITVFSKHECGCGFEREHSPKCKQNSRYGLDHDTRSLPEPLACPVALAKIVFRKFRRF